MVRPDGERKEQERQQGKEDGGVDPHAASPLEHQVLARHVDGGGKEARRFHGRTSIAATRPSRSDTRRSDKASPRSMSCVEITKVAPRLLSSRTTVSTNATP